MSTTNSTETTRIFRMSDDSMAPDIPPGAAVGIDSRLDPQAGDFVLASIDGNEVIRQLDHDGGGGWCLKPSNEGYPAVPLVCALVLGVARQMYVTFR